MKNKIEYRIFKTELRAAAEKPQIEGIAAVFNTVVDLGWMKETIAPGAFKRAIAEKQDVKCLFNHNADHVLGRTKSGTLALSEDNTGLRFTCDMPDTQMGKDVRAMILRGDVDQCSFGFVVREEEISYDADSVTRTLKDCDLFDVSPVTFPAYPTTSVEARTNATLLDGYKRSLPGDPDPDDDDDNDPTGQCDCICKACVTAHPSEEEQNAAANAALETAKARTRQLQVELTL